eukprot:scaffold2968_cov802-Pavlova_lutheri.AAC.1
MEADTGKSRRDGTCRTSKTPSQTCSNFCRGTPRGDFQDHSRHKACKDKPPQPGKTEKPWIQILSLCDPKFKHEGKEADASCLHPESHRWMFTR